MPLSNTQIRPISHLVIGILPLVCFALQPAAVIAKEPVAATEQSATPEQKSLPIDSLVADESDDGLMQSRFSLQQNYQALALPDISGCQIGVSATDTSTLFTFDQPVAEAPKQPTGTIQFRLLADSAPVQNAQQTQVKGHVRLITENSILRAEELSMDRIKGQTAAAGGVSVETPASFMSAETFHRNDATDSTRLEDAQFYLFGNNARGRAGAITVQGADSIAMNSLAFSTCAGDDPDWLLSASELNLDAEEGWGEAWHTVIRIGGVPVFYLPYLNFPLNDERKSGLLMPSLSTGDRNGFDYSQPVYWNIAPNYDATFTPRFIQKRGTQLGTEFRFLVGETLGQFNFDWLGRDRVVEDFIQSAPAGTDLNGLSSQRWRLDTSLKSRIAENWRANLDIHRVSDFDYLRDLGGGLDAANQTLISSRGSIQYSDAVWDVSLLSRHYQSLVGNEPYRELPSLTSSAFYPLVNSGLIWSWYGEYTNFVHPDDERVEGRRIIAEPALSWLFQRPWGYIKPRLATTYSQYQLNNKLTTADTTLSRHLPIFSLDTALYFEKNTQWSGHAMTQTLSPRLFYVNIPQREQDSIALFDTRLPDFDFNQLWRENRFVGYDRIGDTQHIALAVDNRWSFDETGRDLFKVSIGQKFYLKDRFVSLNSGDAIDTTTTSPFLFALEIRPQNQLLFRNFTEWDANQNATLQSATHIKYEPIDNHIVNLSHRYRNLAGTTQEEADFSLAWPINDDWRFMARWYRDMTQSRTIETVAGVEYESCCWALRLVGRRYLNSPLDSQGQIIDEQTQFDSGIQLQFVFKGLGSAGQNGISDLLESSIDGYEDRLNPR